MSKSLHSQYILEREGRESIERLHSFATYSIGIKEERPTFFIHDVFITKAYRESEELQYLFNNLWNEAISNNCNVLMCAVSTKDANLSKNIRVFTKFKFEYRPDLSQDSELLYFSQSIRRINE